MARIPDIEKIKQLLTNFIVVFFLGKIKRKLLMAKIGRNDPCPCGSGKKFKFCCLDTILDFEDHSKAHQKGNHQEFHHAVQEHIKGKDFSSLEELNNELDAFTDRLNNQGREEFFGLSPTQMNPILYQPFSLRNTLFRVEKIPSNILRQIPIVAQVLFILQRLKEVGEIKATQTGNFSRAFVFELYDKFFVRSLSCFRVNNETDLFEITRIRHVLHASGLISLRSKKYHLTKRGEAMLEEGMENELYATLFISLVEAWNWAFGDRLQECYFIQQSCSFNLLLIARSCQEWTRDSLVADAYYRAFPNVAEMLDDCSYRTKEDELKQIFILRFLARFCVDMGLLEVRSDEDEEFSFRTKDYYRVTPLFKKYFVFSI